MKKIIISFLVWAFIDKAFSDYERDKEDELYRIVTPLWQDILFSFLFQLPWFRTFIKK